MATWGGEILQAGSREADWGARQECDLSGGQDSDMLSATSPCMTPALPPD